MIEAPIYGLILAGGPSTRMGENKAELIYHDRPQWAYSAQLIAPYCREVYFSVRNDDQIADMPAELMLRDKPNITGPVAGILAAMESNERAAWMVLGIDMPGVDRALINRIFRQRDANKGVTCLMRDGKAEPLLSIWEPTVRDRLQKYASSGKSSLRQFLQQEDIHIIVIDDAMSYKLDSIDTPEERQNFLRKGRK
ncbi:molybdenum cofactor guanylyltransferase [Fulvivirga sedimenti]|uniref:Molybdenum cofactor guanylyltransferase n=1 Tax=Fulvivirga sedimenti TaxID=2879465 RepID=A0A9X1HSS7_9BACT|nr:molybdenum cofactor guanylyltransferase [Fulvivirga sedimenti]MCA6076521.1 molybdenum cofactor guanylyltransferase [Fulvivirga sedimenti]MCA6077649.1 molybdenum cofactor guanylyltransferase [Fulvivirga sedimenti]